MRLTEHIQVKFSKELSKLCHLAKNLYRANWYVRQDFFVFTNILSYYDLDFILKNKKVYRSLPSQTGQQILKVIERNWKSFLKANENYNKNPKKFKKKPKIPNYKSKNGEFLVIFTNQQCRIKENYLYFPRKVNLKPIKTRIKEKLKEVRIIPKGAFYNIEIVYEKEEQDLGLNKDNFISIDLGLNNLITAVNNIGIKPFVVKGGIVKSINQYYNKQLAYYRSIENKKGNFQDTNRIQKLHLKRNNKINTIFHRISKFLIDYCVQNNIGTIVVGYNNYWKQDIDIGRRNNQNFVQIPFSELLKQLKYKCKLRCIQFKKTDESYTSKCSFLDNEQLLRKSNYLGKRISRGLFKASNGTIINADVNAAYNIMKKAFPNAISADGIEVFGLVPQVIYRNIIDNFI